ncbi:AAA family ATPase, partial [Streptomyces sp. BR123]|uniref:AfsR/SARP family transcriptional regulator n=1 Tax=Streptomyces sp. BR123 TaxID=2749828 RepID=UPI0015C4BA49
MQYYILGVTEARDETGATVPIGGARLRALLAALALRAGGSAAASVADLVDDVWGDGPPQDAPAALQALVARLRRALGGRDTVLADPAGGYRLAVADRDDVDLHRFTRLAREGRAQLTSAPADSARAAETLRAALALWRGPAVADLPEPARGDHAAAPEAHRAAALRDRIEADLRSGQADPAGLLPEIEALIQGSPYDETLRAQQLRALRAAGRRADALAAYERTRRTLAEALGTDPGPELASLHAELLRPAVGIPAVGIPAVGTSAVGIPAVGIPAVGTPAVGTSAVGTPAGAIPVVGTAALSTPAVGTSAAGTSAVGTSAAGTPAVGTPAVGAPAGAIPVVGTAALSTSAVGTSAAGTSAVGTIGTPASGTPASQAVGIQAVGTPDAGIPAAGTPAAGTPAAGTPAAGTPAGGHPGPAGVGPARGNLRPRLNSFVGREPELAALQADLARLRLVTLTGPGGSGKTRLAEQAAAAHPEPAWLVELARLDHPAAVPGAVLSALGLRENTLVAREKTAADDDPAARLVELCADRRLLIVLDNCEHVIGAAAELAELLLTHCPGIRILATSRELLGVPGETVRP